MRLEAEDKIPLPVTLTWNITADKRTGQKDTNPETEGRDTAEQGKNSQPLKYVRISVVLKKLEPNLRSEIKGKRASLTFSTKSIHNAIFCNKLSNDPFPGEDLDAATCGELRSSVRRILKGELLHLYSYSIVCCWWLWTSNFQLIRFCSESAARPQWALCVRQHEECCRNALALLKCCWLVPLEKTNIPWRCLRTEFGPLNWRDTTPLLLMVCFSGTPRSKHYVHMAATASGQARMSLQYPHSNWK